ncbi:MAG: tRNA pseudouridine(55) synthase TruB [Actinomycetota bacterium]
MTDGVVVVDKPSGMTSHDVVDEVRRRLNTRKVGHAGTLDPDATGVLVLGVGRATRLLSYVSASDKSYRAAAIFGTTTTTQDASGEVVQRRDASGLARADVEAALGSFVGDIEQIPPMVSAVKVGGERLYRKARRGEVVERAARRVTIHGVELVDFRAGQEPVATLEVHCSAGTYVRTLVFDLGETLRCGAHLAALRRLEAGGFSEAEAVALGDVGAQRLRPLTDVVRALPQLEADEDAARGVAHGRPLAGDGGVAEGRPVAVVRNGALLAVYVRRGRALVAERVLSS